MMNNVPFQIVYSSKATHIERKDRRKKEILRIFDKSTEQRLITVLVLMLSSIQNKTWFSFFWCPIWMHNAYSCMFAVYDEFNMYIYNIIYINLLYLKRTNSSQPYYMFIKAQLTVYEWERTRGRAGEARTICTMYSVHICITAAV